MPAAAGRVALSINKRHTDCVGESLDEITAADNMELMSEYNQSDWYVSAHTPLRRFVDLLSINLLDDKLHKSCTTSCTYCVQHLGILTCCGFVVQHVLRQIEVP